jgi:hypothetical protein
MELTSAVHRASQILDEERLRPTVSYVDHGVNWVTETKRLTAQLKAGEILKSEALVVAADGSRRLTIPGMRSQNPRTVSETPEQYRFDSANYGYLLTLMNLVDKADQDAFVDSILKRPLTHGDYVFTTKDYHYPNLDDKVSELPLVAEFAIRTGHAKELFSIIATAKDPTLGLALMMMQIADVLSFNFTIFPESELELVGMWLKPLYDLANLQTYPAGYRSTAQNPHYKPGREREAGQIVIHIEHITAQVSQALFFYLKGALQESPNLEIEDDRRKVIGFIESLGFNPTLTQSLNEAEKNYRADATDFELKDCMSHLRSFVEQLHIDACEPVADSIRESNPPKKWGKAIAFLRTNGILSVQEEMFITSLYTLISDEGIHPLIAEREYVRIRRNMVIEYGLMFLTVLDKKGLKVRTVSFVPTAPASKK